MPLLPLTDVLEKTAALQAADTAGRLLAHKLYKVSADNTGKEPARRDLASIMSHKWRDHIPGGLAEGKKPSDFPADDLVLGMTVEMEHTSDPSIACEIAMDHLTEKPNYYRTGDMAKEVSEDLEKVEDGAITLAKQAGVLVARMTKEAWNPLGAIKRVATPMLGRLARPIEGMAAKGMAGGAERAVGKVLPMTHPAHIPTAAGGFSHADTVMDAGASLRNPGVRAPVARTGSLASPATAQAVTKPGVSPATLSANSGSSLVDRVKAVQQRAANQGNLQGAVSDARVQAKAQLPGAPTRAVNIPEGNLGPERRMGADEWIAAHPNEALQNRLQSAKLHPMQPAPASSSVGTLQPPASGAGTPTTYDPIQTEVAKAYPAQAQSTGYDARAQHLLDTGKAAPQTSPAPGWVEKANKSLGSVTPPAEAVVSGVPPSRAVQATGPAVKRFGLGKALAVGVLGAGAYGVAKAVPYAARKIDETSSMPLAYGGGWSPTPYGYGNTPYGAGVQTMGPGA